ncbi:hypothetical protein [Kitasatospora paranensis]|uniref:Uncharacterized protein n=1 Tax=Kitasatospora paranensis TaxID=258053 RepID=A0ABW2G064_9ACTN
MPQQRERSGPQNGRRIDLSLAQVAAAALAAVVGAVLASELGVYGTVVGAAVVSVGATTGGALFQHAFRSTGERLRGVTDRTGAVRATPVPAESPDGWNESAVLRARSTRILRPRTWRGWAAVTGLVFALAMVPIVAVEAAVGKPMHDITTGGSGSGTSLNPGSGRTVVPPAEPGPSGAPFGGSTGHSPSQAPHSPSATPSGAASAAPDPSAPADSPAASPTEEPAVPSAGASSPAPAAGSPAAGAAG